MDYSPSSPSSRADRLIINESPYSCDDFGKQWYDRGKWPSSWIGCAGVDKPPVVCAYLLTWKQAQVETIRIHVSADERYSLFLDGKRVGRGPERGDPDNWFFETYDLHLAPGKHTLAAQVWSLGDRAPVAQMSVRHGFLLSTQSEQQFDRFNTGRASWKAKHLGGYSFTDYGSFWEMGARVAIDGSAFDWGFERGEGAGWQDAQVFETAVDNVWRNESGRTRLLRPAMLPPMMDEPRQVGLVRLVAPLVSLPTHRTPVALADNLGDEQVDWQALLTAGRALAIPPRTKRRVIIDLEGYYCLYPKIVVSGGAGAVLRMGWQEALFNEPEAATKGNRDEVDGKFFVTSINRSDGMGDSFTFDGSVQRSYEPLWWCCGRYVEIVVETGDQPLTIEALRWSETRYPLTMDGSLAIDAPALEAIVPIALRALQMCSHETFMDCPWYEQLMYIGDTRLESLTTYTLTSDSRLPRKALELFAASRLESGLLQARYPSHTRSGIPPFSLWWVGMLYDYALWRGDLLFIRRMMPTARGIVDFFLNHMESDNLIRTPAGWNFLDWAIAPSGKPWTWGIPNGGDTGALCGPLHWQLSLALRNLARLETWISEPELAERASRNADRITQAALDCFWDEERGLLADDANHEHWSEHSQCLALLSGLPEGIQGRIAQGLLDQSEVTRTTIYFSHYMFEALTSINRADAIAERLGPWMQLPGLGLKTTVESPEPSRSDCHAWGAHPIYHFYASLLGIRPGSFGFTEVRIAPQLGRVTHMAGTLPHPQGEIKVELRRNLDILNVEIELPADVSGQFLWETVQVGLTGGKQSFQVACGDAGTG